jgi:glycosyltransferase involved in cell wall biosynthesis
VISISKTLIIHNIPSPYRLPIFQELSKKIDMEVFFLNSQMKGRYWDNDLKKYNFEYNYSKYQLKLKGLIINIDLIRKLLKKEYKEIIIVDDLPSIVNVYITAVLSLVTRKKLIIWSGRFHNNTFKSKNKLLRKCLEVHNKIIYNLLAKKILVYGVKTRNFLLSQGVDKDKIITGTQSYPTELITRLDNKGKVSDGKIIFTTISYLNERKGIDILIKAFKKAYGKNENFELIIVGDGPKYHEYKELTKNYNNIRLLGNLEKDRKYECLSNSDIFVLPTLYDSWGLVLNEAMELNKPIISTDMAMGAHELIEENGVVIKAGDFDSLYNALLSISKEDLGEMGMKSKEIIKKYDVKFVAQNFVKAING